MRVAKRGVVRAAFVLAASVALVVGAGACEDTASPSAPDVAAIGAMCAAKISAEIRATPYSASDFCKLYASVCAGQSFTGMLTPANCVATYESWASMTIDGTNGLQGCASYHLCNAREDSPETHCTHASAEGPCAPLVP